MIAAPSDSYQMTLPAIVELGANLSNLIKQERKLKKTSFVEEMIPKMRLALYQDLGIRFPSVHVRQEAPHLQNDEYAILLNEVPIARGKVIPGSILTNETKENLDRFSIPFTTYKNSLNMPSFWVEEKYMPILEKAGMK